MPLLLSRDRTVVSRDQAIFPPVCGHPSCFPALDNDHHYQHFCIPSTRVEILVRACTVAIIANRFSPPLEVVNMYGLRTSWHHFPSGEGGTAIYNTVIPVCSTITGTYRGIQPSIFSVSVPFPTPALPRDESVLSRDKAAILLIPSVTHLAC